VEDRVRRYRGERSRARRAGVRHRVREQLDVVVVRGDYDRPSTACACQRQLPPPATQPQLTRAPPLWGRRPSDTFGHRPVSGNEERN